MKISSVVTLVGLTISAALPTFAQEKETVDQKLREAQAELGKKLEEAYNNNDGAAVAACYADDALIVTNTGPVYGRQAIDKHFQDVFQNVHFIKHAVKTDGIRRGTTDNEMWLNGEWTTTIQVKGANPIERRGYWSAIHVLEGDTWKVKIETWNIAPAPAATPSPTASAETQSTEQEQAEKTAVDHALRDYNDAFGRGDLSAIGQHCNVPFFVFLSKLRGDISSQGVKVLPTMSEIEAFYGDVQRDLRARGYSHSTISELHVKLLDQNTALASGVFVRHKTDGSELETIGATYMLRKTEGEWKIAMVTRNPPTSIIRAD